MSNDLMKADKQSQEVIINNNNFTKDEFKRFLSGNFTEEDLKKSYYETDNLRIQFDPRLKVFYLYYYKFSRDGGNFEIFGSFKDILKIKRIKYHIKTTIHKEKTEIIKLTNVKGKKEEDTIKEFNLFDSKFIELGQFIKFGNQKEQILFHAYQDFFNFLKSDIIPTETQYITDCYGIFDKNKIFLPNKYNLNNEIERIEELNIYEENLKVQEQQDQEKLKEVGLKLREYLNCSYTSQLLFSYSLLSPFRYFLMNKGLSEFSFLGLRGRTGTGKTRRNKILFNKFHSNYNDEGYNETSLNSPFRILQLQYQNTPLLLDDPKSINERVLSLLKTFATSKLKTDFRGTSDLKTKKFHLIRPIVLSFNRLKITETELIKRFIFLDLTGEKLKNNETQPEEELIKYIDNNIYILGQFYYNNIKSFIEVLENSQYLESRKNSQETVLNLGFTLLNKFFEMLDIEPLKEFKFIDYTEDGRKFIYNDNDNLKNELREQLIKLTQTNIRDDLNGTYNNYNIYDVLNDNLDESTKDKIIKNCSVKGIYLHNNNFLLTKQTLSYLRFKDLKLNNITDLKQVFTDNEFKIIGKTYETQTLKISYYGVKTGFLIINDVENVTEETQTTNELLNKVDNLESENLMLKKQLEEMKKKYLELKKIEVIDLH